MVGSDVMSIFLDVGISINGKISTIEMSRRNILPKKYFFRKKFKPRHFVLEVPSL